MKLTCRVVRGGEREMALLSFTPAESSRLRKVGATSRVELAAKISLADFV